MLKYVLLIAGFVLLIKGADMFVDGSSSAAKLLKIPALIIGMTIVAMGTSLPETSVSVSAALAGKNELAISNVVGSNIFNLMVVCGMCAVLCPLAISRETMRQDFPFSAGIAGLLMLLGGIGMKVGHIDGVILLVIFAGFLYLMIQSAKKARETASEEEYKTMPVWKCLLFIAVGIAAIALGGNMVVNGASDIARSFGMSENLIGMTIVALGTSLPELVTSVAAARKNELDMAVGNVIGSNIFNILLVLGVAAAIHPVAFTMANLVDTAVLVSAQTPHFLHRQESKQGKTFFHIGVVYISPVLVEIVWAGLCGVEPHRALFCFAHLSAVMGQKQFVGQRESGLFQLPADQIGARQHIAPLVVASGLQAAAIFLKQLKKVIGLHQHVVELKEGQPFLQPLPVAFGS